MDEKITSRENAKIKYACRLSSSAAFRRSEGRFLAEGRKLCPELARGAQLETLFYTESAMAKCPELAGLPGEHYLVEDHVADKLADVGTHQGVFGVFRTPVHTLDEVKAGGRYLALERVQDPGNVLPHIRLRETHNSRRFPCPPRFPWSSSFPVNISFQISDPLPFFFLLKLVVYDSLFSIIHICYIFTTFSLRVMRNVVSTIVIIRTTNPSK